MTKRKFELEDNRGAFSESEKRRKRDCDDVHTPSRKLKPDDYTVGWICAIKVEYVAAQEFLDEEHEGPEYVSPQDNNNYRLGSIGKHNVVIATLPLGEYGIASAATVARDMMHSFPNVRIGLMVGIGGGVPSKNHDIRLGDIVVSAPKDGSGGLLQHDFGKNIQDQSFQLTGFLNQPPVALRTALAGLQAQYERKGHQIEQAVNSVLDKNKRLLRQYKRPAQNSDRLYQAGVVHSNADESCILACDQSGLIQRPERAKDEDNPAIHYGLIASASQLMKNALLRDKLAAEKDVLCFEMEAAGLMNHFPCLVIRGICDYADSHKNNEWLGYAAMVAAAYAKDLLYQIAPSSVTAEKRIRDILSDVQGVVTGVEKDVHKLIHQQYSQKHQTILDWLTPVDYAPQHNDFISRRQGGTGLWLLESPAFQAWLKSCRQTLFCPGIPGAGKTIITAIVINHLFAIFRNDLNIGIAYIYCNFRQQDEQTAEKLLTNLLKQLAQRQSSLSKTVEDLFDKHQKSRTRPSLDEITAALHSVAAASSRTFIVIDALDECQDLCRSMLLHKIFNLQADTGANVFATSRINDAIRKHFDGCATVDISAANQDVLAYLDGQISLRRLDIINRGIRDKIRARVVEAAGGMFLLATFHIDTIMSQPTIGEIKEVLQKLGSGMEGLHEIYNQAMGRIEGHTESFRFLAKRILTWITHAKRPLSITEIQHALAVREHMTAFDPDYMPDAKLLKSVCAGLVTTDEKSGIIRLVHYTTQEFFQQTRGKWFPDGESYITKICVTYLSLNIFDSGFCHTDKEYEERLQSNPLYDYAAHNWGHHARGASTIGQEVMDFLKCKMKVEAWSQTLVAFRPWNLREWSSEYSQEFPKGMTGLHLAACFGIGRAVDCLLQTGCNPDVKDTYGRTPLSWAAINGRAAVVEQLLATEKVEADSEDRWNQTPLFYAVKYNHEDVAKLLIKVGVNVNSKNGYYDEKTPLLHAAEKGYVTIAKLLLENGAVVDSKYVDRNTMLQRAAERWHKAESKCYYGGTPLLLAVSKGHETMVRLLLDKGANLESRDRGGYTPLSVAVNEGHVAIVQLLLDKGASIDSKIQHEWTLYSWEASNYEGRMAIAQLLLERGAAVNSFDGKCHDLNHTLLMRATRPGHEAVLRLLLDKEPDLIESKDKRGLIPLSSAALGGNAAIVQILLDKGPDLIESKDEDGQTPLSLAAQWWRTAIIQLLLDKDADLESKDKDGRTPLSWAALGGETAIVQLLLDKGADFESRDEYGGTPLTWAALGGKTANVQLLLDKGADSESKDKDGRTPLLCAIDYDEPDTNTIQLLLDKGADVNTKDLQKKTPLLLAAEWGHTEIIQLLLDNGVDANSKDKSGRTPLFWAAGLPENEYSVQLLLDNGADVNSKDKNGRTPLFWAAGLPENKDTVQLLLDNGADVNSKDKNGRTPLFWAAGLPENKDTVQLLLDNGADVNSKDKNGRTPLLWTAGLPGNKDTVQLLLDKGADINSKDKDEWTPLSWATENMFQTLDTIQLLLDKGANINFNKDGQRLLIWAVITRHTAYFQLLLDKGADVNFKDEDGRTPADWARYKGKDYIAWLLGKGAGSTAIP